MKERYEAIGMEMMNKLGPEHKAMILYWTAFEKEKWGECRTYYKYFKRKMKAFS